LMLASLSISTPGGPVTRSLVITIACAGEFIVVVMFVVELGAGGLMVLG
jgi:hypothetical protein